jgi:hypothetical protein
MKKVPQFQLGISAFYAITRKVVGENKKLLE